MAKKAKQQRRELALSSSVNEERPILRSSQPPSSNDHTAIHIPPLESSTALTASVSHQTHPYSPRLDAQLGGYPPDCGTKTYKYLSFAKVLHERGQTHPMQVSSTKVDAAGHRVFRPYPLDVDFGAHSFHHLPTDSVVLSQYGIGMTLYFKYLKVMAWLFLLLVLFSAPSLIVYVINGTGSLDEFKRLVHQDFPLILGMTTVGHLRESSSMCDQAMEGNAISLACPAGEIGFLKAVYSSHDTQGSCSCPEINKVAEGNGLCRGKPVERCAQGACGVTCPEDDFGCFLGVHPVSKWPCCAKSLHATSMQPNFDDMRIQSTSNCESSSIQMIVDGLCLGRKSCSFNVSESIEYEWTADQTLGTYCNSSAGMGAPCRARITDSVDFSHCDASVPRGLIVYARCFTTRIDLSSESSLKIIGWDSISVSVTRKAFLGFAVGSDIACSICFFLIVLWMRRKEAETVTRITKRQIKAMDYTVQLAHLPRHSDLRRLRHEICSHLENILSSSPVFEREIDRIRIADIQFGKTTSGHLQLLRERGKVVRKLEVALQRLEKVKLLRNWHPGWVVQRKLKQQLRVTRKLDVTLQYHNARIDRWHQRRRRNDEMQAVTAFITFEEEEGFHRCLAEYPDYGFFSRLFQPWRKRLHGTRLQFRPAPDPTDIIWENLHHSYLERSLRQLIVALVTLAVLGMSFMLIFLAKLQKTRLERQFSHPSSCPDTITKDDVVEDEHQKQIGLVPYKSLVECFCKTLLTTTSYSEMTREVFVDSNHVEHRYCKSWATAYVTTQALSVLSVVTVVGVNVLLARILNVLVTMEKHHTESDRVVSRITKVFFAQFCNTAILLVVINANLGYFLDDARIVTHDWQAVFPILNGKYSDFSPAWYNDVGVALILTMIVNTFSPHVYGFMTYVSQEASRYSDRGYSFDFSRTKQDTQRDLEALYRGPQFDLAARYAQSLTAVFITYLFSAGMPILHLVGFLEMLVTYWADKFTFLRIARAPPLYAAKVAKTAASMLPYAVVLHSLVAMWMFSNEMIFQSRSDILKQLANDHVFLAGDGIPSFAESRGQIFDRVTRPQVVILFVCFVTVGVCVLGRLVFFRYFPSAVESVCPALIRFTQKTNVAKGVPNYFDALPTHVLRDKIATLHPSDHLRDKCIDALKRRDAGLSFSSAASIHPSDERWITGCASYALRDNKEYVAKLAIDSHLTADANTNQIF